MGEFGMPKAGMVPYQTDQHLGHLDAQATSSLKGDTKNGNSNLAAS